MAEASRKNSHPRFLSEAEQLALAQEIAAGNQDAFRTLVRVSQRHLYQLIWRFLRNHEDTNDVLQESYLRLFENAHRIKVDKPILPYLRKIAVNLSLNRLKAAKREVPFDGRHDTAGSADTERAFEKQELLATARAAMATLPKEQRLVLVLRVQDELSYQEIADILQLRLGTVMSRLARAREKVLKYVAAKHNSTKNEILIS